MKREIKFRAFGSQYMSNPFTLFDIQERKIEFANSVSIMQFTGLLDKNGKEIYEDDVLIKMGTDWQSEAFKKWEESGYEGDEPAQVEIKRDVCTLENFRYWLKDESFGYEGEDLETAEEWEIIGNIHENPELLK